MKKLVTLALVFATSVGFSKTLEEHLTAYKAELDKGWMNAYQYVVDNQKDLESEFVKWEKADFDSANSTLNSMMFKFYDIDLRGEKKLNPPVSHLITNPNLMKAYHSDKINEILNSDKYLSWQKFNLAIYVDNEAWLSAQDLNKFITNDKFVNWKLKKLIMSSDVKAAYDEALKMDNILTSKLLDKPNDAKLQALLKSVQNIEDQLYIKLSRQNKL